MTYRPEPAHICPDCKVDVSAEVQASCSQWDDLVREIVIAPLDEVPDAWVTCVNGHENKYLCKRTA